MKTPSIKLEVFSLEPTYHRFIAEWQSGFTSIKINGYLFPVDASMYRVVEEMRSFARQIEEKLKAFPGVPEYVTPERAHAAKKKACNCRQTGG